MWLNSAAAKALVDKIDQVSLGTDKFSIKLILDVINERRK